MRGSRRTGDRAQIAALTRRIRKLEAELSLARNPLFHFDLGLDRRISRPDAAMARVTGRSVKQLDGMRFDKLVFRDHERIDFVYDHFLKGQPYRAPAANLLIFELDNSGRRFQLRFRPVRDRRGRVRGFRVTGRDITAQFGFMRFRETEIGAQALYRTMDRVHTGYLHAFNRDASPAFTPSTLIGGLTNGMARRLGYLVRRAPGEMRLLKPELDQQPVKRLLAPSTIRALNRSLLSRKKAWIDGEIVAADHSTWPVRFSISSYKGAWGNTNFVIMIVDRTEDLKLLRRLDERLVESEEKYRNLFQSASDAIFLEDFDGNILDCNRRACELYGYSHDEMLDLKVPDLLPDDVQPILRGFIEALSRDGRAVVETCNRRSDGSLIDVEVTASIVEIGGRRLVHAVCRDITERKMLHSQVLRTARLAAVGTLAAGVAHEINNPVAVIAVDLLRLQRQRAADAFVAEICAKLLRMTERITSIVKGLLTFSRPSGGVFGTRPLHEVLTVALDLVSSRFDYEHKRLARDYPKALPGVWCASDQLEHVFVNVSVNALEAMGDGGTLTVSAETDREGGTVSVRFKDTGKGMGAEELDKAFDPFFTTKDGGTGLGLTISHGIVAEHGGRILLDSAPREGTTVTVILPLPAPAAGPTRRA